MPSVRSRFVVASSRSKSVNVTPVSAVIWCTITSGAASLDGGEDRLAVEAVGDDRRRAGRAQRVLLGRRPGHGHDLVAVLDEQGEQAGADRSGGAGEEDLGHTALTGQAARDVTELVRVAHDPHRLDAAVERRRPTARRRRRRRGRAGSGPGWPFTWTSRRSSARCLRDDRGDRRARSARRRGAGGAPRPTLPPPSAYEDGVLGQQRLERVAGRPLRRRRGSARAARRAARGVGVEARRRRSRAACGPAPRAGGSSPRRGRAPSRDRRVVVVEHLAQQERGALGRRRAARAARGTPATASRRSVSTRSGARRRPAARAATGRCTSRAARAPPQHVDREPRRDRRDPRRRTVAAPVRAGQAQHRLLRHVLGLGDAAEHPVRHLEGSPPDYVNVRAPARRGRGSSGAR